MLPQPPLMSPPSQHLLGCGGLDGYGGGGGGLEWGLLESYHFHFILNIVEMTILLFNRYIKPFYVNLIVGIWKL